MKNSLTEQPGIMSLDIYIKKDILLKLVFCRNRFLKLTVIVLPSSDAGYIHNLLFKMAWYVNILIK